jgi:hypothetical protein
MSKSINKIAAEHMLQLDMELEGHKKQAHALRLIYLQNELGYGEIPASYSELQEKVASLINQGDLNVLEKALELTGGNMKLGELDGNTKTAKPINSTEKFISDLLANN